MISQPFFKEHLARLEILQARIPHSKEVAEYTECLLTLLVEIRLDMQEKFKQRQPQ